MASDTLTRWGISLATTALAAAVVVGCAPDREDQTDPVGPEQGQVSTAPAAGPEKTPKTPAPKTTDAGAPDVQPDDQDDPDRSTGAGTDGGSGDSPDNGSAQEDADPGAVEDPDTIEDATAEDETGEDLDTSHGTSSGSPGGNGDLFHPGLSAGHDETDR